MRSSVLSLIFASNGVMITQPKVLPIVTVTASFLSNPLVIRKASGSLIRLRWRIVVVVVNGQVTVMVCYLLYVFSVL